jgi:lia operon protein LiaF
MSKSFRIFLAIEGVLALLAIYSIFHSRGLGVLAAIAFVVLLSTLKRKADMHKRGVGLLFAGIILAILIFSNIFVWLMLGIAIVYFTLFTQNIPHSKLQDKMHEPEMVFVKSVEPETQKNGACHKGQWFGSKSYGSDTYEWDDINIINLVGDTIIDLGNTLLPKEDSVILIRKGAGRTRILVPMDVGVVFEHATLAGTAKFEGQEYKLSNETLKVYSKEYEESSRRLRIVSSTLLGEIEVIRI